MIMRCIFCKKKVELRQRIKLWTRYNKMCRKCEGGVKRGIVIGAWLVEEAKKPRTIVKMGKPRVMKGKKTKIRRG
jgi:hypothetical protein